MKKIIIGDKEYPIACNAFTRFQYKKVFNKGIFADIKILNKFSENQNEIRKNLEEKAKNSLVNFKGDDIGFVSRDSSRESVKVSDKILNDSEFAYFLMNVFNTDQNSSYVVINDNKAILYKINKQKLDMNSDKFKQYKTMLEQNLQNLKANELKQELVDELKKIYPIKIYYKGN